MADKLGSRISVGLLAAVTLSLSAPALAQNYTAADTRFIPGTTYSGGTMPQNYYNNRGMYWWGGGGGYGGYGGGSFSGMNDYSNQLLYTTADGPQPTTTPVPSYQTEAMDAQMTAHQNVHTDGPSMSFNTDDVNMPKASSYFKGFWKDMQGGSQLPYNNQRVASAPPQGDPGPQFARPSVQSRLSPVEFNARSRTVSGSSYAVRTELKPKLEEARQLFEDMRQQGKLGTFDLEPLEQQWKELRRRAQEVDNIQNSVEQKAEEGKLINQIEDFEYQLKQHNQ